MSSVDRVGDAREQWWPAWLVAGAVLLAAAILMQQFSRGLHEATLDRAPPARVNSEKLQSPGVSELTVASKVAAKSAYLARLDEAEETDLAEEQAQIDAAAVSRPERLRAAIMAGELIGAEAARQRLDALAAEADPAGDLARELHWLVVLYREGRAAVPPEAQDSLVDRHGWFGRLALSHGMPDSDRTGASCWGDWSVSRGC